MVTFLKFALFLAVTVYLISMTSLVDAKLGQMVGIAFQKRAGEQQGPHPNHGNQAGPGHTHPHNNQPSTSTQPPPTHSQMNQAGFEFSNAIHRLPREGHYLKGVINAGIKGNPLAETASPITTFHEGRKRGTIVTSFSREPSPPRPVHPQNIAHLGQVCVNIGECQFVGASNRQNMVSHSKIGHVDARLPNVLMHNNESLRQAHMDGLKAAQTSVTTLEPSPRSGREQPMINIIPGRDSGQYFSALYRPTNSPSNSPPRSPGRGVGAESQHPAHHQSTRQPINLNTAHQPSSSTQQMIGQKRRHEDAHHSAR